LIIKDWGYAKRGDWAAVLMKANALQRWIGIIKS